MSVFLPRVLLLLVPKYDIQRLVPFRLLLNEDSASHKISLSRETLSNRGRTGEIDCVYCRSQRVYSNVWIPITKTRSYDAQRRFLVHSQQ